VDRDPIAARAHAQDLIRDPGQDRVTRQRLIPAMGAIVERLRLHRGAVDEEFLAKRAQASVDSSAVPGELRLSAYPVGFCLPIRDQVWERALGDPFVQEAIGRETVVRKIFVLLKGRYFQNAVQLGNLYIDVANDTVWPDKPKIEWAELERVPYENVDRWAPLAAVARRYLNVELYPNFLFPLAFPVAPFFAIRPSGRIDLFLVQDILLLKDLGDGMRRAKELLDDANWMVRRLPAAYETLLRAACGANLHAAFPLEYAPVQPADLRTGVLAEFATLAAQPPERVAATIDQYLGLVADATKRLARLNLIPPPAELARLRADGAAPPADHVAIRD
jgi:hypothetical protein